MLDMIASFDISLEAKKLTGILWVQRAFGRAHSATNLFGTLSDYIVRYEVPHISNDATAYVFSTAVT